MPDTVWPDVAERINGFSATELLQYVTDQLHGRKLHVVVRELNALVLSKRADCAEEAQRALVRLGFPD